MAQLVEHCTSIAEVRVSNPLTGLSCHCFSFLLCLSSMATNPRSQHPGHVLYWELILEREGNQSTPQKNPQVRLRLTENSAPRMTAEMGGANVEYNANLTSPGIQHRGTRIVAHPDINPAQQDLTLMIKWETVFSLGQAVLRV